jgi:hypothetical protein
MAYSCLPGALRKHIVSLEFSDHFPDFLLHFCKIFFCSGLEATNCILGNRFHLRLNFKVQHIIIECIFLSERQHYVTFHPFGIFRYHWSLMFTFLFIFLFPIWKGLGDIKFWDLKLNWDMKLNLSLIWDDFFGSFFFKCLGSPCYLMVVSGGSFFSGGCHKDTSRCFLWCLQVLFNIEFLLAVIFTSFSVRRRLHARPPLENAWPLALIDQFTKWRVFFSFNFQMYEDNVGILV